MKFSLKSGRFFRDQWVQVRSYAEIAATLDADGKFEGVPFSAEMARYCGTRARVFRRADKTCVAGHGMRRMKATVFLQDLRCDGEFHDGCQRNCLLFWKEAWLKPADHDAEPPSIDPATVHEVRRAAERLPTRRGDRYICQSTELYDATQNLSRWNIAPWLRDIAHGELTIGAFLEIVTRTLTHRVFGWRDPGALVGAEGKKRKGDLNLESGSWINVKESKGIEAELDPNGHNCGLSFTPSMAQHIGGRYQVEFPIKKNHHRAKRQDGQPDQYGRIEGCQLRGHVHQELPAQ
ncbi:hypothetical protein ACFS07_07275 [Undibacterium arcticum]